VPQRAISKLRIAPVMALTARSEFRHDLAHDARLEALLTNAGSRWNAGVGATGRDRTRGTAGRPSQWIVGAQWGVTGSKPSNRQRAR